MEWTTRNDLKKKKGVVFKKKSDIIKVQRKRGKKDMRYKVDTVFKVTEKGAINQVQRNQFKKDLEDDFIEIVKNTLDWTMTRTSEGILIEVPNNEEGIIPVIFSLKVKNLGIDTETLKQDYQDKQDAKKKKAEEKERKKQADIKKRTSQ